MIEYDPDPPFDVGSPDRAPADLVISVKTMMAPMLAERRAPCERAAARLKRH
jgi:cyclohexyl-isocyanide hydratase